MALHLAAEEGAAAGQVALEEGLERGPEPRGPGDRRDGLEEPDPRLDEAADALGERTLTRPGNGEERGHAGLVALARRPVEVLGVVEVPEHRPVRHPRACRHVGDARVEDALAEQVEEGVDDGVTVAGPARPAAVDLVADGGGAGKGHRPCLVFCPTSCQYSCPVHSRPGGSRR
ncbi:MAG: hypothetical protein M5U14_20345 [Acidimicrobiia bacterium]|nr:hypothetical protein [Acidimicrobiia bacterium]